MAAIDDLVEGLPTETTDVVAEAPQPQPVPADAPLGGEAEPTPQPDADLERRARSLGWKPKENWSGEPGRWKPATEFLAFHDAVLPLVQRENKALRDEIAALKTKQREYDQRTSESEKRAAELREQSIVLERDQAYDNGDRAKADKLNDELIDIKLAKKVASVKPVLPDMEVQRIWSEFESDNEWVRDPEMQEVITEQMTLMRQSGNTAVGRTFLDKAKDRVKRLYPERFPTPARRMPMADVDGRPGSTAGRSWSDVNPETRKIWERTISEDAYMSKDPKKYQARFLAGATAEDFRR